MKLIALTFVMVALIALSCEGQHKASDKKKVFKWVLLTSGRDSDGGADTMCLWRARRYLMIDEPDIANRYTHIKIVYRTRGILPLWRRVRCYSVKELFLWLL